MPAELELYILQGDKRFDIERRELPVRSKERLGGLCQNGDNLVPVMYEVTVNEEDTTIRKFVSFRAKWDQTVREAVITAGQSHRLNLRLLSEVPYIVDITHKNFPT